MNLSDVEEDKKDEKQKELSGQISGIQENIARIDSYIGEIRGADPGNG